MTATLRILILGAHPDDAEYHVGGLLNLYRELDHHVRIVSLTDGAAGHHETRGPDLVRRRRIESERAAALVGADVEIWDYPDGLLEPTLEARQRVIREIRRYRPDLVLTHRPCDYHPDHRAVAQLVQDASYLVTVPAIVPDTAILRRDPVVAYMPDHFTRPTALRGDVVVDVTRQLDRIVSMLACHESQFFEWLAFNQQVAEPVPRDAEGRHRWLRDYYLAFKQPFTSRYAEEVLATYGAVRARDIEFVEVLEISEYACPLNADLRQRLFPFVP